MATTFNHSAPVSAGTTRTLLYGPVSSGTTALAFSGTLANVDDTNKTDHWVTVERYDGTSTYTAVLNEIPVKFGATSECPKMALVAGESVYVTADAVNVILCALEVVILA